MSSQVLSSTPIDNISTTTGATNTNLDNNQLQLDQQTSAARAIAPTTDSQTSQQENSSSQTPTLKRKLTDLMDDLVAKAKASKDNDGKRIQMTLDNTEDDDERLGNKLAQELSCAICSDIFVNPVTCLDCLHVFCGEFFKIFF